jgi:hypothetical protein
MFGSLPLLAFLLGFTLGSNLPRLSAAGRAFIRREYYTTGARGKQDRKGGAAPFFKGLSIKKEKNYRLYKRRMTSNK